MLDKNALKNDIQGAIETVMPSALKQCVSETFPVKTESGDEIAESFAQHFTKLFAEPFADQLAGAIDTYIKNMSITGTIITTGTPFTQTCQVISMPMPVLNGKIPMTLGVS